MFSNLITKRHGFSVFPFLFVLAVLAASVVSFANPNCRERTEELTIDGICVGGLISTIRLIHLMRRSMRISQTLFSWWCVARVLFGVELRYGLVGGYLLGITRAIIHCLT